MYKVKYESPQPREEQAEEPAQQPTSRKRKSLADVRAEITPAPVPDPAQLGLTTALLDKALAAGPAGIRKAQQIALKFAKRFQQENEDQFKKVTAFLAAKQTENSEPSARACARYALVWRPKFLSALSLTHSPSLAARFARINQDTAYEHRKLDGEFAAQWEEAMEHAVELLHSRCFQRALEGDCEPIFYMGKPVGYVRKFDSRLQIELLRAYKPEIFKTPGANINIGTKGDVLVLTEKQRHRLMEYNREFLLTSPIKTDKGQPHNGNMPHKSAPTPKGNAKRI